MNHSTLSQIRRGLMGQMVLVSLVAITLVGTTAYFVWNNASEGITINPILATVKQGDFVSQVLDQGEIQSSENVEIRCEVRARNGQVSVIEVATESTLVKGGDFLVRLDSTSFETELESQEVQVTNAETALIRAEADLTAAKETLKEYIRGTFLEKVKMLENDNYDALSQIETARQDVLQAKTDLAHAEKLQAKGFITKNQLDKQGFEVKRAGFALQRAENLLELVKQKQTVLQEITKIKETVQLESDIKAAEVKLTNQKTALKIEIKKRDDIKEQIEKCTIRVPEGVSGQITYAKESSRGREEWMLEEGTTVRERQVLIRLPNPQAMEVKALINEQSITQIEPGMPCTIKVDALNNVTLKGVVTKVNQYAENGGWMSSAVRKYAVYIKIIDPPLTLKPGMNAAATIQVRYVQEALTVPIQSIYGVQDRKFCLVKAGENTWETREVTTDGDNSQIVLVTSGLTEGEQLVMNPGAYKEFMNLPELELDNRIELSSDEMKTVSDAKTQANAEKSERGGQRQRGQGGEGRRGGGGGNSSTEDRVQGMMDRFDSNADGKIDSSELEALDERIQQFVKPSDTNGDGEITKKEMVDAFKKMSSGRGGRGGGGGRSNGGGGQ